MLTTHEMRSVLISSSMQINVWNWISIPMHWKWWWQNYDIIKFVPVGTLRCSHENRKTNECQSVKTRCANNKLKVTVSWNVITVDKTLVSLLRAGIKMTVYGMATWRIPDQRKSSKCCHQWARGSALSFCDRKGVILLDLLKARQTINTDHCNMMLTKLANLISLIQGKKEKSLFHFKSFVNYSKWF